LEEHLRDGTHVAWSDREYTGLCCALALSSTENRGKRGQKLVDMVLWTGAIMREKRGCIEVMKTHSLAAKFTVYMPQNSNEALRVHCCHGRDAHSEIRWPLWDTCTPRLGLV
jgi:hypothetical protein